MMRFVKESFIRAPAERVFAFHELPDALQRLTPPWAGSRIVRPPSGLRVGSEAVIEVRVVGPVRALWVARHTAYDPPRMFEDVQLKGPFRSWRHRHFVTPREGGALLRDEIEYAPPFGFLGRLCAPFLVTPRLEKLFEHRHAVTRAWCEASGTGLAEESAVMNSTTQKRTKQTRGFVILGVSLALLFGVAFLKGRVD